MAALLPSEEGNSEFTQLLFQAYYRTRAGRTQSNPSCKYSILELRTLNCTATPHTHTRVTWVINHCTFSYWIIIRDSPFTGAAQWFCDESQHSPDLRVSCLKEKHHFTSISFIKRPLKHLISCRLLPPNAHGKRHFAKGQAGHFLCPAPKALSGSPSSQPEAAGTQVLFCTQVAQEIPLLPKLNQMNKHDSELLFSSFPAHHRHSWAGRGHWDQWNDAHLHQMMI